MYVGGQKCFPPTMSGLLDVQSLYPLPESFELHPPFELAVSPSATECPISFHLQWKSPVLMCLRVALIFSANRVVSLICYLFDIQSLCQLPSPHTSERGFSMVLILNGPAEFLNVHSSMRVEHKRSRYVFVFTATLLYTGEYCIRCSYNQRVVLIG